MAAFLPCQENNITTVCDHTHKTAHHPLAVEQDQRRAGTTKRQGLLLCRLASSGRAWRALEGAGVGLGPASVPNGAAGR